MTDYFERIEGQLVESALRIYPAGQRQRTRSIRRRQLAKALATAAALSASAIMVLAALTSLFSSAPGDVPRRGDAAVQSASVLAGVRATFVTLRRARQPADQLPTFAFRHLPTGTVRSESRQLLKTRWTAAWFVPGTREECVVVLVRYSNPGPGVGLGQGGGGCGSPADAEKYGIIELVPSPERSKPAVAIVGILPDNAITVTFILHDGSSFTLRPNSQGAFVHALDQPVTRAFYRDSSGVSRDLFVPSYGRKQTPAPPNPCPPDTSWCR
jgi:hypothetical protein